jgi:adenylate cyclase
MSSVASDAPAPLAGVLEWFLSDACRSLSIEATLGAIADLLCGQGFPVWRISTSLFTSHPEIHARELVWTRGAGLRSREMPYGVLDSPAFQASPIAAVFGGESRIRCRLWIDEERRRFPVLDELARAGATDYIINGVRFSDGRINCITIASDRAEGFSDAECEALRQILPLASMRLELESHRFAMQSLLAVYLGSNAATRVATGAFRRGSGEKIEAAVWFSDLRGFTALGDTRSPEEVVATLDAHFERIGGAVEAEGGEILKFIGDAVLAIFPCRDGGPQAACERAARAAEACQRAMDAERAAGTPMLEVGIALHLGEVMYGNIGTQNRLDFTVIGAAVNVASRVEGMCKTLGQRVLLTGEVAQHLQAAPLTPLGEYTLRGVSAPVSLYAPAGSVTAR